MKFTPKPWKVKPKSGRVACTHVLAAGRGRELFGVAHVFGDNFEEEMANARLIAAAPDMYGLLVGILYMLNVGLPMSDIRLKNSIKAVLKKIERK